MNDLKSSIKELCTRLEKALDILCLEKERDELKAIEKESTEADFWQNQTVAQEKMQKISQLKKHIERWDKITKDINDLTEMIESTSDDDHKLIIDLKKNLDEVAKSFESYEFELLLSEEYDKNNAILSISAGSGGTDAQDWAEMLLRMYLRFCEKKGFENKIVEQTKGEEAGIKSVTVSIKGLYAYGYLKSEFGVHRLVRLSPYDSDKARHTSFALVEIIPEIEDIKFVLNNDELRIDVYRAGGHGGQSVNTTDSAVRITHMPTGVTATSQNERSQLQNRESALKVLKSKLAVLAKKKKVSELAELKGEPVSAEWGNQIRSYVLHPYTLVKDNRTQFESSDTQAVLDGYLDEFIEAYLRKSVSDKK